MGSFTELLRHVLLHSLVVTQGLERLLNMSTNTSQLILLPALKQSIEIEKKANILKRYQTAKKWKISLLARSK